MKKYILILSIIIFFGWGCDDNEFLNRKPTTILMPEDVWQDNELAFSVLADLYRRLPEYQTVDFWGDFTTFNMAFASNFGDYWRHQNAEWSYDEWGLWNYGLIREVNLFIKNTEDAH